jgi:hypothetical protein
MSNASRLLLIAAPALFLPGCAAKTIYDVATTPVRTTRDAVDRAGKTYDFLTTSQSEKDEKRGRSIRKREERLAKLERRYREESDDCAAGDEEACDARHDTWDEMEAIRPTVPAMAY